MSRHFYSPVIDLLVAVKNCMTTGCAVRQVHLDQIRAELV